MKVLFAPPTEIVGLDPGYVGGRERDMLLGMDRQRGMAF